MKKLWLLTFCVLLLLLTICACNEKDPTPQETDTDVQTDPITEVQTEAPTQEETAPLTEENSTDSVETPADFDDVLDSILSENEENAFTNYHLTSDLLLEISAKINGFENKMSMNGGLSIKQQAGDSIALELNIPTMEPQSMVYVDGMLYLTSTDGKYRCPLDEVEEALLWAELIEDLFPSDDSTQNDLFPNFSDLLATMKISALFSETSVTTEEATGDIVVSGKGLSEQAQALLKMFELSDKLPQLGDMSDLDTGLLLDTTATIDPESITFSLTVDQELQIKASLISFTLDMSNAPDLMGDIPTTMTVTLNNSIERGEQMISAPEDAESYEETDWRVLFGFYTPEMLSLIPDEQGVITLSNEAELFALQYNYIRENPDEFKEITFSVTAHASDFVLNQDGSITGTIFQVYEDGTAAYYPYLSVVMLDSTDITLPTEKSIVKLSLVLPREEDDGYDFLGLSLEIISGPVAVG